MRVFRAVDEAAGLARVAVQVEIANEVASVIFLALAAEFLEGNSFRVNGLVDEVEASIEIDSEVI